MKLFKCKEVMGLLGKLSEEEKIRLISFLRSLQDSADISKPPSSSQEKVSK